MFCEHNTRTFLFQALCAADLEFPPLLLPSLPLFSILELFLFEWPPLMWQSCCFLPGFHNFELGFAGFVEWTCSKMTLPRAPYLAACLPRPAPLPHFVVRAFPAVLKIDPMSWVLFLALIRRARAIDRRVVTVSRPSLGHIKWGNATPLQSRTRVRRSRVALILMYKLFFNISLQL